MSRTVVKKTSSALAGLMSVALLLTGCGADAEPDASPSSTTSSSPAPTSTTAAPAKSTSPSPSSTASQTVDPNIPAAARAHTVAGAEAFVRYFYSQLNIAWTTPQPGILSPLCRASSKACSAHEKTATRLAKQGHRYDGNPVTMGFIGVLDATNPNKFDVLANLVQEPRSEIDPAGRKIVTDKRKNLRVNVELLYTDDAWSIASTKAVK